MLPNGTATNGFTGALVMQSLDTGGTVLYMPSYLIDPTVYEGREAIMLINNENYPVNELQGTSYGLLGVTCPLMAGIHTADFFSRAVGSGAGDTGASGYWTVTVYADNQGGDAPKVFGRCKFGSVRLRTMFSQQASQQITFLDFQLMSCDPESTAVTPLAAPPAGPLSQGKILGFADSGFSGFSSVVAHTLEISTGLQFVPGTTPGNQANLPSLPLGLKQNTIDGTASFRQVRNPAQVITADGTAVVSFGKTGAGIAVTEQLMRVNVNKRQSGGINYQTAPFRIKSNDGSSPLAFHDL